MTTEVLAALEEAKEKISANTETNTKIKDMLEELVASLDINMPYILGGTVEEAAVSVISLAASTAAAKKLLNQAGA